MNTLHLNTASLDDIVFEGRNQSYGAYVLRRIYSRHLVTGLTISILLCLLLVALPLLVQRLWPAMVVVPPIPVEGRVTLEPYTPPKEATKPAAARLKVPHTVVVTPRADRVPQVVKDPLTKPQEPLAPGSLADPGATVGPAATDTGLDVGSGPATAPHSDSGKAANPAPPAPFVHVEVMPEFAGGADALRQYMQRNLKYPRQALAGAVSGKVFVAFTVQASGAISDVQVLKGLGYGTDEEAARVVKEMPAWTPGRQNSHPVAVRYTLPITFRYE
ncbi:protein TonB [Hymenobacter daecheongensis DSM 21074]|uniref:Protein TonB n=1 Tax=Hymenobacter daecheongensis DSM 21074 TaxID=1121955 RepID=A0A1M6A3R6_9BACT|nr:energy transducer TonB [Hymenobacter daecheongensis]SHI31122.1 protein TonB [Hymenobacter daecheongensis DSM 21074]